MYGGEWGGGKGNVLNYDFWSCYLRMQMLGFEKAVLQYMELRLIRLQNPLLYIIYSISYGSTNDLQCRLIYHRFLFSCCMQYDTLYTLLYRTCYCPHCIGRSTAHTV